MSCSVVFGASESVMPTSAGCRVAQSRPEEERDVNHPNTSTGMRPAQFARVQGTRDPEAPLRRPGARSSFCTWYFGFIVLAGFAPDFMGEKVIEGLTVGYILAARANS